MILRWRSASVTAVRKLIVAGTSPPNRGVYDPT